MANQWLGDFNSSFSLQYNDSDIDQIKVPALLDGLQAKLFDRVEQVRLTKANPAKAGVWSLGHQLGALKSSLRLNYFGPYTLGYATGDKEFAAKTTVDLTLGYAVTESFDVTLGASNLFDVYPDEQPVVNSFNGIFKYPNTNAPFGFNGGSYYLDLTYKF